MAPQSPIAAPPMRSSRGDRGSALPAVVIVLVLCALSYYAGANPDRVQDLYYELKDAVQR